MAILTLGAAAGVFPLQASAGSIEARLGTFLPRADSTLFQDTRELFGARKGDWRGFTGGFEFAGRIAPNIELGVHVDAYSKTLDTSYVDYVRPGGREIQQSLKLETVPVGFTLRVIPGDRGSFVRPYVGVGADLIFWKYEEFGDFVDFGSPDLEILPDAFRADGVQPGFHATGGLRLRLTYDLSFTAEARYQWAGREKMGDDFAPNAPGLENVLDLNGASFTAGLHLRF
jgi:opacity protein-like surface antigen